MRLCDYEIVVVADIVFVGAAVSRLDPHLLVYGGEVDAMILLNVRVGV